MRPLDRTQPLTRLFRGGVTFAVFLLVACAAPLQAGGETPPRTASPGSKSPTAPPDSAPPDRAKERPPALQSPHCAFGCPRQLRAAEGGENPVLFRQAYALCNNPKTKFADWVAYHVTTDTIGKSPKRIWKTDPDLPPLTTLSPDDFRGAYAALHVDRGHQVPLASFGSTDNVQELNYMSNVTPQKSALNQQLWRKLEEAERDLAQAEAAGTFVLSGPLYEREMPPLPGTQKAHRVPSGYFKVVLFREPSRLEVAAFIVAQEVARDADYCAFQVTVREAETRSGYDFFSELPDDQETTLETRPGTLGARLGCGDAPLP